jgi:large subunit ribosomal protein L24
MKIKKGDTVEVIRGDHRGERGKVNRVIRKRDASGGLDPNQVYVVVAGVNLIIKHQRRTGNVRTQTGRIEREAPIHVSNVMLVAPKTNKPVRVAYLVHADGSKSRRIAGTDEVID